MKNDPTYYITLITRYLSGEASLEEMDQLIGWIEEDDKNHDLFREYQQTWGLIEKSIIDQNVEIDAEWAIFQSRLDSEETFSEPVISPGRTIPRPVHNQGVRSLMFLPMLYRVAAILIVLAVPLFLVYFYFSGTKRETLRASASILESRLPDGTSVTLNTGSLLVFPNSFHGNQRNVSLIGEAWFEVAHDSRKPFIISNDNVRIEVYGTTFYVNTVKSSQTVEVILATGKVSVYYNDKPAGKIFLLPGEKAEIMKNGQIIRKSLNTDENYLSWKTRVFVFNDAPVSRIFTDLNNVYHSHITWSDKVSDCRITATFNRQSLESILNVLQSTVNIKVSRTGSAIEISGEGCN